MPHHYGTHAPYRISVTCYMAKVMLLPLLQPIKTGTKFSDPGDARRVDLVGLVTYPRWYTHLKMVTHPSTKCDEQCYHYAKPANKILTTCWLTSGSATAQHVTAGCLSYVKKICSAVLVRCIVSRSTVHTHDNIM